MSTIYYQVHVKFGDTDGAGIVFYPNYYRWMDEATHHFLTTIGFSTAQLIMVGKVGMPIVEAKCQFRAPLLFDDIVTVNSMIVELKEKVFTIEHTFLKEKKEVATGYEIRAWCDLSGERPKAIAIPKELLEAVNTLKRTVK
ncbi:thioesterase family protein [Alkalihalobacillus sp. LMS39]|uniref:acyl-CoA thioesterase n=1 Tax=Alkalihalobacillus sp. LMS39 TaxID=2924032 RepID=UPI001FB1D6E1|nr:thioesterase family protein [Alkalihalobacillus sp. LMS39]UOE92697.1 acyl-CoA thioesterase [Alkalihalobacillus sp. LMS39]